MKITTRFFIVLFLLVTLSCSKGVEAEDSEAASTSKDTSTSAITFIELGSVNCVPCKMMQPIMEKVEVDFGDRVDVVFYDVWTEVGKPYAREFGIQAIPTQVFLDKEGNEYFRHVGFFPQDELYKILEQGLALN